MHVPPPTNFACLIPKCQLFLNLKVPIWVEVVLLTLSCLSSTKPKRTPMALKDSFRSASRALTDAVQVPCLIVQYNGLHFSREGTIGLVVLLCLF